MLNQRIYISTNGHWSPYLITVYWLEFLFQAKCFPSGNNKTKVFFLLFIGGEATSIHSLTYTHTHKHSSSTQKITSHLDSQMSCFHFTHTKITSRSIRNMFWNLNSISFKFLWQYKGKAGSFFSRIVTICEVAEFLLRF